MLSILNNRKLETWPSENAFQAPMLKTLSLVDLFSVHPCIFPGPELRRVQDDVDVGFAKDCMSRL